MDAGQGRRSRPPPPTHDRRGGRCTGARLEGGHRDLEPQIQAPPGARVEGAPTCSIRSSPVRRRGGAPAPRRIPALLLQITTGTHRIAATWTELGPPSSFGRSRDPPCRGGRRGHLVPSASSCRTRSRRAQGGARCRLGFGFGGRAAPVKTDGVVGPGEEREAKEPALRSKKEDMWLTCGPHSLVVGMKEKYGGGWMRE
jgi:hypothetical protein